MYQSHSMLRSALAVLFFTTSVKACMWDRDTLKMETQRFPSTLELITGKFIRHSEAYYRWRIEDRTERIKSGLHRLDAYDDLAVAYDKLGEHDKAINTMLEKQKTLGGSGYETHANLGTFYIHKGEFELGLRELDIAVEINPDAHFGREIYQRLLVRYIMLKRNDGELSRPLATMNSGGPLIENELISRRREGFGNFVLLQRLTRPENMDEELRKALKGVQGMMHFGQFDHPVLLEALGDLLLAIGGDGTDDGKRLAARAYLKASYSAQNARAKDEYRQLANAALAMQTDSNWSDDTITLATVEERFREEQREADAWFAEVQANEKIWIAAGEDVDAMFDKTYYDEPRILLGATPWYGNWNALQILTVALACAAIVLLISRWYSRSACAQAMQTD